MTRNLFTGLISLWGLLVCISAVSFVPLVIFGLAFYGWTLFLAWAKSSRLQRVAYSLKLVAGSFCVALVGLSAALVTPIGVFLFAFLLLPVFFFLGLLLKNLRTEQRPGQHLEIPPVR